MYGEVVRVTHSRLGVSYEVSKIGYFVVVFTFLTENSNFYRLFDGLRYLFVI